MSYKNPWFGISTAVSEAKTAEEVIDAANLNWKVDLKPLYLAGNNEVDGIKVIGKRAKGRFGVVRDDTNDVLGVVKGKYTPIQNRECFGFLDILVDEGIAKYTDAGYLKDGSKIFMIAELDGDILARENDAIKRFFCLTSSHDGSSSVRAKISSYRLVCSNGLTAEIPGTTTNIRVQHSQKYKKGFEEARKLLGISDIYYKQLDITIQRLVNAKFNTTKMRNFVETVFPATRNKEGVLRVTPKIEETRDEVFKLFTTGVGAQGDSAWDAYNAVTEFVDHAKRENTVNEPNRSTLEIDFKSNIFGRGASVKQRAFELLTKTF